MATDMDNNLTYEQRSNLMKEVVGLREDAAGIMDNWGGGGTYRQITTALVAGASGNVTAAGGEFMQAAVVNYVQQQGAEYIGELVANNVIEEGSAEHAALHAVVACGGAAASGQDCSTGALGAAASSLLTNLFDEDPNKTAEQMEAERNIIAGLVGALATTTDMDVSTAVSAAIAATDNNLLGPQQKAQRDKELAEAKTQDEIYDIAMKWQGISEINNVEYTKSIIGTLGGDATGAVGSVLAFMEEHPLFDPSADRFSGVVDNLKIIIDDPAIIATLTAEQYDHLLDQLNEAEKTYQAGFDDPKAYGQLTARTIESVFTVVAGVSGIVRGVAKGIGKNAKASVDLPTKINAGQQGKHLEGHNNYIPGRSPLIDGIDPQELLNGVNSGSYKTIRVTPRDQPVVDFGKVIGKYNGGGTQYGIVHHGKNGAHIVPANPIQK